MKLKRETLPRLYISACSNSVSLVPLHLIIISILLHHKKELLECIREIGVRGSAAKATSTKVKCVDNMKYWMVKEEEEG
jgi:hypothetical protein